GKADLSPGRKARSHAERPSGRRKSTRAARGGSGEGRNLPIAAVPWCQAENTSKPPEGREAQHFRADARTCRTPNLDQARGRAWLGRALASARVPAASFAAGAAGPI